MGRIVKGICPHSLASRCKKLIKSLVTKTHTAFQIDAGDWKEAVAV